MLDFGHMLLLFFLHKNSNCFLERFQKKSILVKQKSICVIGNPAHP